MNIQYKKITTHALNLTDYNPKNTIRFLKQLYKNNLVKIISSGNPKNTFIAIHA